MNILVLSWRDPKHPLAGGAEQVMHEHMKGWVKAGHSVLLFSSNFKGASRNELLDGVFIKRYGFQLLGVQLTAFIWYFLGRREKFDLVVDQFHGIPFFTPLYVREKKIAVIQEVAKEVWLINHLPKPFNYLIGIIGYYFEPFFFLFYRNIAFITGSNSAKKDLLQFKIPEKNIFVIPHGVIVEKIHQNTKRESVKTIIFLGALAKDKGVEDAITAFSKLEKRGKFNYWIVGKGSEVYLKHLKNKVSSLEIDKKTKFFGFVSQKKKFRLLSKAHILINPSIREGWGLVNIEANSVSTPVVAYYSQGLIDSVKNGMSGVIVEKNTPEALAKAVDEILANKRKYSRFQKGARAWSRNFTWKKSSALSLRLINTIIPSERL